MKKILYIDMDNVLVDFQSGIDRYKRADDFTKAMLGWDKHYDDDFKPMDWEGKWDECPFLFGIMQPMPGAVESFHRLSKMFDTYILSTAPWLNPTAWMHKREWVQNYLGEAAHKRLILTHHKHLNKGHYLIDDRTANGADRFEGTLVQFGTPGLENWEKVMQRMEMEYELSEATK